jgi:hypothetical protein
MKRFVILCTSLVLSIPMIGCGAGGSSASATSTDPSHWGEAKKYQAKVEAERAARAEKLQKKKLQPKKR